MVLPILAAAGLSYLAGKAYKRYATPQQKKWENFAKIHHGEAGIIMLGIGILAKSPNLAASGVGLILHDRADHNKWFAGHKRG